MTATIFILYATLHTPDATLYKSMPMQGEDQCEIAAQMVWEGATDVHCEEYQPSASSKDSHP
jgi:hypothetical protein